MDSIIFEATQACNHNCLHCYNVWKSGRPYPAGQLDTPETLALLDRVIRQTRCQVFSFTGGEPLLRPDLLTLVDRVASRGPAVNLLTNGSLLTDEAIRNLIDAGVSLFEIPLLSADRAEHNALTRSESFDRVTEAISGIKLAGGRVITVFVVTRGNHDHLHDMLRLSFALNVDGVMVNRFNPGGEGLRHLEELLPTPEQVEGALEVADRDVATYGLSLSVSVPIPPCLVDCTRFTRLHFGFCAAATERAYHTLDPLGNLRMCNHSPMILGNLRETGFRRLIRAPAARAFARALPAECRGCARAEECRGDCKAAAEQACGCVEALEPFVAANATRRAIPRQ